MNYYGTMTRLDLTFEKLVAHTCALLGEITSFTYITEAPKIYL